MCDCEPTQFYKEDKIKRSRKVHRCGECLGWIMPSESYYLASGLTDSRFWTAKTCVACHELYLWIIKLNADDDDDCCMMYGELVDEIKNRFWDLELTPEYRQFLDLRTANYAAYRELKSIEADIDKGDFSCWDKEYETSGDWIRRHTNTLDRQRRGETTKKFYEYWSPAKRKQRGL